MSRPDAVECADFESPSAYPHGAPLLLEGVLQAGWCDATFINCPDVYSIKARHVIVASHRYAVAGGIVAPAAACSPTQIAIDVSMMADAIDVRPNGRCRRPGCRQLFARVLEAETSTPAPEGVTE